MAKILRYNGNLVPFASASLGTERTIFGGVTQADDITSQFTADFLRGWGIVGPSDQPTLQDFNAVSYTNSLILSYLHQIGVAEYNPSQEYHIGSFANVSGVLYVSNINNNVGNAPASSPSQWKALPEHGLTRFTANGSFTVPSGVTVIYVSGCAAGGGGGSGGSNSGGQSSLVGGGGGGGGGAGQSIIRQPFTVTPGLVIALTLGTGGTGGTGPVTSGAGSTGASGANTVIGSLITLAGGSPGGGGNAVITNAIGGGGAGGSAGAGAPAGGVGSDGNYTGTGGAGASCPFGGGGANGRAAISTTNTNAAGTGSGFGSGGGGGGGGYGSTDPQYGGSGGAGSPGIVIIEW